MPIFCNQEIVREGHPKYDWVKKRLAAYKERTNVIIVSTNLMPTTKRPDGTEVPYIRPNQSLPTWCNRLDPKTSEVDEWRWSTSIPRKKNSKEGEVVEWNERQIIITNGTMYIDTNRDAEKAFYLVELMNIEQYGRYKVEDLEGDAKENIKKLKSDAIVRAMLFTELGGLENNDSKVREIALGWGITKALTMGINLLKETLYEEVMKSEQEYTRTHRGVQDFLDDIKGTNPTTEFRINLTKALGERIIVWDDRDNHFYWTDRFTKEKAGTICAIPATRKNEKEELLLNFFKMNPQEYDTLKGEVQVAKEGYTDFSSLSWAQLKEYAKEKGIPSFQKKRPELEEELMALSSKKNTLEG